MSSQGSSNTLAYEQEWPTIWESETTTPPGTPPRRVQTGFEVINTIVALRACLDEIVREASMPPKWYSQAHILPRVNTPYTSRQSETRPLSTPVATPQAIFNPPTIMPQLYVDAEGISLSRSGELSILILHVETTKVSHTYLLYLYVLGPVTFAIITSNGLDTLRPLLFDNRLPKVLFDCRMDSDALFGQFGVLLGGVIDLQLMRLATRNGGSRHLPSLGLCLEKDLDIPAEEQKWVDAAKSAGQRLWRPRCGGSMERFNDDPLHEDIVNYCVADAAYLPRLFEKYNNDAALKRSVDLGTRVCVWPSNGTIALPSPSPQTTTPSPSPLLRRGAETVRVDWIEDPKHRGTLHCFTTGTEMGSTTIAGYTYINHVCGYSAANAATAFNYTASSNGTYPHQYTRIGSPFGKDYIYSGGAERVVWYDMQLQGKTHANYAECRWAIEKIVLKGGCPDTGGTGGSSFGGWWQFEDDGSTVGVDPTHESASGRSRMEGQ
ncbi:MAG: hypothetical protein Q9221_006498 [Calogaya cf. arnoldii]